MGERLAGTDDSPRPSAGSRNALVPDADETAGLHSAPARDAELVRAALCEVGPAVRRYLFGMCGDWDEAEDLTQEALLKAWRKRAGFDGRADPKTWIFRIARNHWLDGLRRRRVRPIEQAMTEDTYASEGSSPQPFQAAARGELAAAIHRALGTLPPEQQEALALRESEGMTFPQIAALLHVPAATVKSRVRYALMKLADELHAFRAELES